MKKGESVTEGPTTSALAKVVRTAFASLLIGEHDQPQG